MVPPPRPLVDIVDGDAEFAKIIAHAGTLVNTKEKDDYLQQQLLDAYQRINDVQALLPTPPQSLAINLQLEVESQNMLMEEYAYEMDCTGCGQATSPENCLKTLDLMTRTFNVYRAAVANQLHHERQRADFHRARATRLRQERNSARANLAQLAKFQDLLENGGVPVDQQQAAALLAAFSQARGDLDQIQQGIIITNEFTPASDHDDEADLRADQVVHPDDFPSYAGVSGLIIDFQTTVDSLNARICSLAERANPANNPSPISESEHKASIRVTADNLAGAEGMEELTRAQLQQETAAKSQAVLKLAAAKSQIILLREQLQNTQQAPIAANGGLVVARNEDRLTIGETLLAEQVIIDALSAGEDLLHYINNLPQPVGQIPQDIAGLQQQLARCHATNENLQAQLATRNGNGMHQAEDALQDAICRLAGENSAGTKKIKNLQDQLTAMIDELNTSAADNQALREALTLMNNDVLNAAISNRSKSPNPGAPKTLQDKVTQLEQELINAERDLARADGARKKFKNAQKAAQENAAYLQKQLDESAEHTRLETFRVHSRDVKITNFQNRLDHSQVEIDRLNAQITKLTESNQTLRNDLAAPHATMPQPFGISVTVSQLQRANAALARTVEKSEHNLKALQSQSNVTIVDLQTILAEVTAERNDVRWQLTAQQEINHTQLAGLPGRVEDLEALVKKLTAEKSALRVQVDDYLKLKNDCVDEKAKLNDDIVTLTIERDTARREKYHARAQRGVITAGNNDVVASMHRVIDTLTTERDQARTDRDAALQRSPVGSKLAKAQQELESLQAAKDAASEKCKDQKIKLKQEIDSLIITLTQTRDRVKTLAVERDAALQRSSSTSTLAKLRKEVTNLTAVRDASVAAEKDCKDEKRKLKRDIAKLKAEKDTAIAKANTQSSPVVPEPHNGDDVAMTDTVDEPFQQGDDGQWGDDDQFDPPPDDIDDNDDEPVDDTNTSNALDNKVKNLEKREELLKKANQTMAKSLAALRNPKPGVSSAAAAVLAEFAHQEFIAQLQDRIAELEAEITACKYLLTFRHLMHHNDY